jgi:dihydrofolate reductase
MKIKISIIAAIGKNRELGKNNKLLWHIPEDLERFKKLTQNHVVIMGRKTFESLGKPLPNRVNIVITRDVEKFVNWTRQRNFFTRESHHPDFVGMVPSKVKKLLLPHQILSGSLKSSRQVSSLSPSEKIAHISPNLIICSSLENAIKLAKDSIIYNLSSIINDEVFVIGGGQIYEQGIKYADKLYLTIVEGEYEADTFFPDYSEFKKIIFQEKHQSSGYSFTFIELER